ncbi:hypothetical protein ACFQGW_08305 [Xanthomonas theicola]|nr:hypothetical protein [Xanthomonas theicola]
MLSRTEFEVASAKRMMRAPGSPPRSAPPASGANRQPRRAIPVRRTPNDPALRGDANGILVYRLMTARERTRKDADHGARFRLQRTIGNAAIARIDDTP